MRHDMAKLLTHDGARGGATDKSKKWGKRYSATGIYDEDFDSGPNRVKSSRRGQYGWNAKEHGDYLKPLHHFLRSRVGCKWDDVFSEICAHAKKRTMRGYHLHQHLRHMVETSVALYDDGHLYSHGRLWPSRLSNEHYVDDSGVLRWAENRWTKRARRAAFAKREGAS